VSSLLDACRKSVCLAFISQPLLWRQKGMVLIMKKAAIILAIIFALSFTGFLVSVFAYGPFYFSDMSFHIVPKGYKEGQNNADYEFGKDEKYSNINLNVESARTILKPSNDGVTRVSYRNSDSDSGLKVEVKNNSLNIEEESGWGFFGWGWFGEHRELMVEIPEKDYEKISLKISSGSIHTEFSNIKCGKLSVSATSGEVKINGIKTDKYSANCASGSLNLNGMSGEGDVNVSSGEVTVRYDEWDSSLKIKVTSGSANFYLPPNSGLKVESKVASGEIKYRLSENSGNLDTVEGVAIGGDNTQDVNISVASGEVNFHN
jgi:DUF4097 and DUF4098 domain-containing protein YvlB